MNSMVRMIGGTDGPTSIFIAGRLGPSWINFFGLILIVLVMIPNIIYALKYKDRKNLCTNKTMNILEQIGRYACMFFMVINVGFSGFGFSSIGAFLLYFLGNVVLLLVYYVFWILFFKKNTLCRGMALAILPTVSFVLSGLTLRYWLLVCSAILFGVGHIYVTYANYKNS